MMGDRAEVSTVRLRTWPATLVAAIVGGCVFGIVASAVNGAGVPALVPASLILGVGWSWAGAAILLGRLAVGWRRSALAGLTALVLATCGYYVADLLRGGYRGIAQSDPTGTDWGAFVNNVLFWSIVSCIVGPLLGLIGAASRRGDACGLACKLVLPAVAAAEMADDLRNDLASLTRPVVVATWNAVLVCALASAALLVVRHLVKRSAARRS